MTRNCPHCGKLISWWRPLRTAAVSRAGGKLVIPVPVKCSFCGGLLVTNPHPTEQLLAGTAELWALVVFVAWYFGNTIVAITIVVVLAMIGAGIALRLNANTKQWPRYVPYEAER